MACSFLENFLKDFNSKYLVNTGFLKVSYTWNEVVYPDKMRELTDVNSNNTFRKIKCAAALDST